MDLACKAPTGYCINIEVERARVEGIFSVSFLAKFKFYLFLTFVEDLCVTARISGNSKPRVEARELADLRLHDRPQTAQRYPARLNRLAVGAVGIHYLHGWPGEISKNKRRYNTRQACF